MSRSPAELLQALTARLRSAGVDHALIGGLAVSAYGHVRATHDVDFLIRGEDATTVRDALTADGFEVLDFRPDIASYVRGVERVDFLHARREISGQLLADAQRRELWQGAPLISIEGLIGLKVQAYTDNPRRTRDMLDILELLKRHRHRIDMKEVRGYFALFDREALLDAALAALS